MKPVLPQLENPSFLLNRISELETRLQQLEQLFSLDSRSLTIKMDKSSITLKKRTIEIRAEEELLLKVGGSSIVIKAQEITLTALHKINAKAMGELVLKGKNIKDN